MIPDHAADAVLDQWDVLRDAGELVDWLEDARLVAEDAGAPGLDGIDVHVVPCVPGRPITASARIDGLKLARIDGRLAIYLFADSAS